MLLLPRSYFWIAIPLYISHRLYYANRLPLTDCDEVFNFWEPLAFVLQGQGLQTWEYSAEYALRTYAYLIPMQLLAQILLTVQNHIPNTVWIFLTDLPPHQLHDNLRLFLLLRASIATVTATSELLLLYALSQQTKVLSRAVVIWTAAGLLFSTGMNHAAAAYLPTTTFLVLYNLGSACLLLKQHVVFVLLAVTGTLTTAWPFGIVVLVPHGIRIMCLHYQHKGIQGVVQILLVTFVIAITVQIVVMLNDQLYYGTSYLISPTVRTVQYNLVGGGDALYGVEPMSFYIKNLFLNLNGYVLLAVPSLWVTYFTQRFDWDVWVIQTPIVLWAWMVLPRPHKEERFLVPIYSAIIVGAVLFVDAFVNAVGRLEASLSRHKQLKHSERGFLHAVVWIPILLVSISRTTALQRYYTAPWNIYATVPSHSKVCVCGEWYRFVGSLALHPTSSVGFLPSSFEGQLPQYFTPDGSRPSSTNHFNDQNQPEPGSYSSVDTCDYIVDLDTGECTATTTHAGNQFTTTIVQQVPFLDAEHTTTLHRILYLPYWHEHAMRQGHVRYHNYVLYRVEHESKPHKSRQVRT